MIVSYCSSFCFVGFSFCAQTQVIKFLAFSFLFDSKICCSVSFLMVRVSPKDFYVVSDYGCTINLQLVGVWLL